MLQYKRNYSDHLLNIDFSKIKEFSSSDDKKEDVLDVKLAKMYQNLTDNEEKTEMKSLFKKIRGNIDENKKAPSFIEFKKYVKELEKIHEICGKNCVHLKRFYANLGWEREEFRRKDIMLLHKRTIKKI